MTYGYVNGEGEFVSRENVKKAEKCSFCGNVVEEEEYEDEHKIRAVPTELINADTFNELRDEYRGSARACSDCISEGVGEPGEDWDPSEVFDEKDEDTVEV